MQVRGKAAFRGVDRDSESFHKLGLVVYHRNYGELIVRIIDIADMNYNAGRKSFSILH